MRKKSRRQEAYFLFIEEVAKKYTGIKIWGEINGGCVVYLGVTRLD